MKCSDGRGEIVGIVPELVRRVEKTRVRGGNHPATGVVNRGVPVFTRAKGS